MSDTELFSQSDICQFECVTLTTVCLECNVDTETQAATPLEDAYSFTQVRNENGQKL